MLQCVVRTTAGSRAGVHNSAIQRYLGATIGTERDSLSTLCVARRGISTGEFDHPPSSFRRRHTYNTLPTHDANRYGGRSAYFREIGPFDHKRKGRLFKRDHRTLQYNIDIWAAQQTLRKKWKARDWEVVELPYSLAPREMRKVIPEMYTDIPQMCDPVKGDFSNIRSKVYDRESLQDVLYGRGASNPYPQIKQIGKSAMTIDKFL